MATFNEIYKSYLQNPYAGVNAIAPVQGIGSLQAQPSIAYSGDGTTTAAPTTTGVPSTFQPTMMDMVSLALNPLAGVANLASRTSTGLSLAERAMDAMGIGRGPGGRTEGYGVDSVAGMTSGPTQGVDDVNSQSVAADASAGGAAGAAAASAAGSNDGPGGGTFAKGGRVGFSNGSSDKIDYWITVQEMYDNAGGEAGTGLGLIDFANKYFPKMATGGRAGYLQGGLVSLLR